MLRRRLLFSASFGAFYVVVPNWLTGRILISIGSALDAHAVDADGDGNPGKGDSGNGKGALQPNSERGAAAHELGSSDGNKLANEESTKDKSLHDDELTKDDLKQENSHFQYKLVPPATIQFNNIGGFQFSIWGSPNAQTGFINNSDGSRQTLTVFSGDIPLNGRYELEASHFYMADSTGQIVESGYAAGVANRAHTFAEAYLGETSQGSLAIGVLGGSTQGNITVGVGVGVEFSVHETALGDSGASTMGPTQRAVMESLNTIGIPPF
jgi:hypothetical protein